MPINSLLEDALNQPAIGETGRFRWHATPVGIAALCRQQNAPLTPPLKMHYKKLFKSVWT